MLRLDPAAPNSTTFEPFSRSRFTFALFAAFRASSHVALSSRAPNVEDTANTPPRSTVAVPAFEENSAAPVSSTSSSGPAA